MLKNLYLKRNENKTKPLWHTSMKNRAEFLSLCPLEECLDSPPPQNKNSFALAIG